MKCAEWNEKKKKQQANASRPVWIVGMNERLQHSSIDAMRSRSLRREPKRKEQKRTEQTKKGTGWEAITARDGTCCLCSR